MDQEKFAALIKLIMADPRIMELIRSGAGETGDCCDLTLIETGDMLEHLPLEWRGHVYCQERDGSEGLLSYEKAVKPEWKQIRIYQPSLNFIAKLAQGIADEPILKIVQEKLVDGAENIQLVRLSSLSRIKADSYKKLFLGYTEKIRSFGIRMDDEGFSSAKAEGAVCVNKADSMVWQFKALTEKDLLDVEKGTVLTVGKKCIITSLAVDMAKRKSIRICREGEGI